MRGVAIGSLLFALSLAACGARTLGVGPDGEAAGDASVADSGTTEFPVGTYTRCAQGLRADDHEFFLDTAGFLPEPTVTVTQSGATLTATYTNVSAETEAFDFAVTTSTSATLAPAGQISSGFTGFCVRGPGRIGTHPSDMTATAGTLTYDSGALFIFLQGTVRVDAGSCGVHTAPARSWIVCQDGPPAEPVDMGAPPPSLLPVGVYECTAQVATYYHVDGTDQYVTSGRNGALVLMQTGGALTARYSGDPYVAGALRLSPTTATTATADMDQSVTAPCEVPVRTGMLPPPTPETLQVAAGLLTADDSTLLFAFAGTMGPRTTCPGALKAASLICSRP